MVHWVCLLPLNDSDFLEPWTDGNIWDGRRRFLRQVQAQWERVQDGEALSMGGGGIAAPTLGNLPILPTQSITISIQAVHEVMNAHVLISYKEYSS